MRSISLRSKWLRYALVLACGVIIGQMIPPLWVWGVIIFAEPAYQEATYRCDRSMRAHLLAKQKLEADPSAETVRALEASEVALIDCQDYDLMRKRLMLIGLDEAALGYMALKAIEAKATDLQDVIEIHEIRY
ncbi:TIGR03982 family His-Xaa-Ser system protein [Thioclava nitratireducens]|uniref:TIGR03982 family His-Xaa-Ser system protein n=1 Tax=Thioclava nitratireducens TaxID=1915078 RepID=UPI00248005E2|nr:TIGR03982 family His-Xaa-Ser system protein [Thioclava nitratireducens]WGT48653.1 TIGR03982 family His-Xaa-Ser system protein [Thioclava nitratireducens]